MASDARERIYFASLAISPAIAAVSALLFRSMAATLVGDIFVIVPLILLAFSAGVALSPASRRLIRLALGSCLLLIPAFCLYFAPDYSVRSGQPDAQGVYLVPDHPARMVGAQTDGSAVLYGLNARGDILIWKWDPTSPPHTYGAQVGIEIAPNPPYQLHDQNNNSISFSSIGVDLLRFQDNRGGSADVQWDGHQFVLAQSTSAARSPSGRTPTAAARRLGDMGQGLILLPPILAWLILTFFGLQRSKELGVASPSLVFAVAFQCIAVGAVLWFALDNPGPTSGDIITGAGCGLLISMLLEVIALLILAVYLLRLDFVAGIE